MELAALDTQLGEACKATRSLALDPRDLMSPQARLGEWRLAFEHGNSFETVALQWLGEDEPPPNLVASWRRCPPAERRRGWDYRATLPPGGVREFVESVAGFPLGPLELPEEDDIGLNLEGRACLRFHKQIERRPHLARLAKLHHGYVCQGCGFDFEGKYGALGHKYIEAHHLHPLGSRLGIATLTDPARDFAVLCSNCHRMIHRSEHISDVKAFRRLHVSQPDG